MSRWIVVVMSGLVALAWAGGAAATVIVDGLDLTSVAMHIDTPIPLALCPPVELIHPQRAKPFHRDGWE